MTTSPGARRQEFDGRRRGEGRASIAGSVSDQGVEPTIPRGPGWLAVNTDVAGIERARRLDVAVGLIVGKPLGIVLFSWASVRMGLTKLPSGTSWPVMLGAGCLGGIGFTMSLFIAGQAFPVGADFAAAKIAVFAASALSAVIGEGVLFGARAPSPAP